MKKKKKPTTGIDWEKFQPYYEELALKLVCGKPGEFAKILRELENQPELRAGIEKEGWRELRGILKEKKL